MRFTQIRFLLIALFAVISMTQLRADFGAHTASKWAGGECQTTFYVVTTGDAGPYTVDIEKGQTVLHHEENLPSDMQKITLSASGSFIVRITDSFGCDTEIEVEGDCECEDIEHEITPPSCHADNGVLELIPPQGGMVNIDWVTWPPEGTQPATDQLIINNLVKGIYKANITMNYPDPAGSGDFIPCTFEKEFDLSECKCEFEINIEDFIEITPSTSCRMPNGKARFSESVSPPNVFINGIGGFHEYTYAYYNAAGQLIKESNSIKIDILDIGEYTLEVTDLAGCKVSKTFDVELGLIYEPVASVVQPCDGLSNGSIDALTFLYSNDYSTWGIFEYRWSTGFIGQVISDLTPGEYSVTLTDAVTGCEFEHMYTLENTEIDVEFAIENFGCNYDDGYRIFPNQIQGLDFEWEDGSTNPYHGNLGSGEYSVTVSTPNGCSKDYQFSIDDFEPRLSEVITGEIGVLDCSSSATLELSGYSSPYKITHKYDGLVLLEIETNETKIDFIDLCRIGKNEIEIIDVHGCKIVLDPMLEISCDELDIDISFTKFELNTGTVEFRLLGGLNLNDFKVVLARRNYNLDVPEIYEDVEIGIGINSFEGLSRDCEVEGEGEAYNNDDCRACYYVLYLFSLNHPECFKRVEFKLHNCRISEYNVWIQVVKHIDESSGGILRCGNTVSQRAIWVDGPDGSDVTHLFERSEEFTFELRAENISQAGLYTAYGTNGYSITQYNAYLHECTNQIKFGGRLRLPKFRDNDEIEDLINNSYGKHGVAKICDSNTNNDNLFYVDSNKGNFPFNFNLNPYNNGEYLAYDKLDIEESEDEINVISSGWETLWDVDTPDYSFEWENEYNESVTQYREIHDFAYTTLEPSLVDVCKKGRYLFYQFDRIFDGGEERRDLALDYILFTICDEYYEDVCDVYPYSRECLVRRCSNGVQDGDETGVDCGGSLCASCPDDEDDGGGNGGGDDSECVVPDDCPLGETCENGECVTVVCDPDAIISNCPGFQICVGGDCVLPCPEQDCPDGYICGPDGYCVEDPDDDGGGDDDECDPVCDEPDYICIDGECVFVGEDECDDETNPCPDGQFCQYGECEDCPIVTGIYEYGTVQDCKYQLAISSDKYVKSVLINVYENGVLIEDWDYALSGTSDLELGGEVPLGGDAYVYKYEIILNGCIFDPIVSSIYRCIDPNVNPFGDCNSFYVSNDPDEVYAISHSTLSDGGSSSTAGLSPVAILSPLSSAYGSVSDLYLSSNMETEFTVSSKLFSAPSSYIAQEVINYQSFDVGVSDIGGLTTQAAYVSNVNSSSTYVSFAQPFVDVPVVLLTQVGINDPTPASVRVANVTRYGFDIHMRESGPTDSVRDGETVSYVAIEKGEGFIDGRKVVVGATGAAVSEKSYILSFVDKGRNHSYFESTPYFFGFPQTSYGDDLGILTYQNLDASGIEISIQEEQLYDVESAHPNQDIGYVLIEKDPECECEKPIEDLDLEITQPTCGLADGSINFSIVGGVGNPYLVSVNGNESVYDTSYVTYANLSEGQYIISVQDTSGCEFIDTIDLVASELSLENYIAENVDCESELFNLELDILGGTPPFSYNWSNGSTSSGLTEVSSGYYTVTVADSEGCIGVRQFHLRSPYLSISTSPASCGLDNGSLTANTQGIEPFTYLWSNGATGQTVHNLFPGSYTVTVTDAAGCTKARNQSVLPDGQFTSGYADPFCGGDNGYAEIIVEGEEPIVYSWNTGQTTAKITGLSSGTYSVTATDAVGCVSEESFDLEDVNTVTLGGSGGNEGFSDGRFIPGGVTVDWSFNPQTVTDQLIVTSSTAGVILNTGGVTRTSQSCCGSTSCCSDIFLGDHMGSSIDLLVGSGFVNDGTTNSSGCNYSGYLNGSFTFETDSYVSLEVIGSSCGGNTGWSVAMSCNGMSPLALREMEGEAMKNEELENSDDIEGMLLADSSQEIKKSKFNLYPNPTNSVLYIDSYEYEKGTTVTIIDVHGKVIMKQSIEKPKESIDVSDMVAGIYVAILKTPTSTTSKKFVVNN